MPFPSGQARERAKATLTNNGKLRPTCSICGQDHINYGLPKSEYLHPDYPVVDHIIPTADGGSDDITNLSIAARRCNNRKNRYGGIKDVIKRTPGINY